MLRPLTLLVATAAVFAASAAAATVAPETGKYAGRTTADASGKPRAIAFAVKRTGCGAAAYCVVVDPESFLQGKCAASGYMYNAFFPVTTPIPIPGSGRIDHGVHPLRRQRLDPVERGSGCRAVGQAPARARLRRWEGHRIRACQHRPARGGRCLRHGFGEDRCASLAGLPPSDLCA